MEDRCHGFSRIYFSTQIKRIFAEEEILIGTLMPRICTDFFSMQMHAD